jgi:hypothetical protein
MEEERSDLAKRVNSGTRTWAAAAGPASSLVTTVNARTVRPHTFASRAPCARTQKSLPMAGACARTMWNVENDHVWKVIAITRFQA